MEEHNYCKYCKKNKDIKDFYKCNLSLCKDCKKNINKMHRDKNQFKDKYINNIELLLKELYKNTKNIENSIKTIKLDNNFNEIEDTIDKINYRNKNIDETINTIINCKKN
jgi:acyl-[acyl carrier protein]--UDP-N-acetylglucosamine O-acyltransferase